MGKVYAVKKGFKTGIFTTWEECKNATHGYSGAVFKGFGTMEDAEDYLGIGTKTKEADIFTGKQVSIYVDGSFSKEHRIYSYGCVIIHSLGRDQLKGVGYNPKVLSMQNVAGELMGAMTAVTWAVDHGFDRLHLYHDYTGIQHWATGEWRANKEGTQWYQRFMERNEEIIEVVFHKVLAHSGDNYNEEADQLAAKAIDEFVLQNRQGGRK